MSSPYTDRAPSFRGASETSEGSAAESEFLAFCRERAASEPYKPLGKPEHDGCRQRMLLTHLDDLPGQLTAFDD